MSSKELPSEWKVFILSEIGEVISGGTPKTNIEDYWNGDISWITPKDLSNFSNRYIKFGERNISKKGLASSSANLLPRGTILFSSRAPIGYLAIADGELSTNQGFKSIVVNQDNDNLFVYYLLKKNAAYIEGMANGSTFKEISGKVFKNLEFVVPPLSEQKVIAHILSTLDDKLEVNNRINKNLEDMAQAIFKRWFVDFEFPNEDGEPYKSSGGEMVESDLGMIPKGWSVKPLGRLIEIHDSKRVPLSSNQRENMGKKFPYYGAASLMDYVDDFLFDGTYVLLGEDGTVIKDDGSAVLQYVWGKFWVNNHAHVISGKSNISINFIYALLKSIKVSEAVTGAVQKKINQKNLTSIKVIVPDATTLIGDFSKIIEASFDLFKNLSDENKNLTKLRDVLLPKLMSGEIRVPIEEL